MLIPIPPTPFLIRPQRPNGRHHLLAWQALAALITSALGVNSPISAKPVNPHELCELSTFHVSKLTARIQLPAGLLPPDIAVQCAASTPQTEDRRQDGTWALTEVHWMASCMRHRPLYFEEIGLERYGHSTCYALQPFVSATKFFANTAALPYKMALEHPNSTIYTLGHARPGDCVPRHCWRTPLRLRAGMVEASVVIGLIFLIP